MVSTGRVSDSLVLGTHPQAGGAHLARGTLEFGVGALAGAALAGAPAVADLLVAGQTRAVVQGAVAGAARPHGVTLAHSAVAGSVT